MASVTKPLLVEYDLHNGKSLFVRRAQTPRSDYFPWQ